MTQKIFWFDTETTGVDSYKCDIVQLAYIIEIDGVDIATGSIRMRPHEGARVDAKALEVNGLTEEAIWAEQPQSDGIALLLKVMGQHIDKHEPKDKFVQAGYNIGFDDKFLRSAFNKLGNKYYGSWFFWPKLDVSTAVAQWVLRTGERPPNYKLSTLCAHFDIPLDAHDAVNDIKATRELAHKLLEE